MLASPDPTDLEAVRAYGSAHSRTYRGEEWDGSQLVVFFTQDLTAHLRAIRGIVSNPNNVRVEKAAYSLESAEKDLQALLARYRKDDRHVLQGWSLGRVTVNAQFEDVAADLHEQFGRHIQIVLGLKPYPPSLLSDWPATPLPKSDCNPTMLDVIFEGGPEVAAGDNVHGNLTITNRSDSPVRLVTSMVPITGGVRRPGADILAGRFAGSITFGGGPVQLRANEAIQSPFFVGTASCLPDPTYVVPPGLYEIVIPVRVQLLESGHGSELGTAVYIGPRISILATH